MTKEQFACFVKGDLAFRQIIATCLTFVEKSADNEDGVHMPQDIWDMYWVIVDNARDPDKKEDLGLVFQTIDAIGHQHQLASGCGFLTESYNIASNMDYHAKKCGLLPW